MFLIAHGPYISGRDQCKVSKAEANEMRCNVDTSEHIPEQSFLVYGGNLYICEVTESDFGPRKADKQAQLWPDVQLNPTQASR